MMYDHFSHGCVIDLQILFAIKHKKIMLKYENVGMSLINVWLVAFIHIYLYIYTYIYSTSYESPQLILFFKKHFFH